MQQLTNTKKKITNVTFFNIGVDILIYQNIYLKITFDSSLF